MSDMNTDAGVHHGVGGSASRLRSSSRPTQYHAAGVLGRTQHCSEAAVVAL